MVWSSLPTYFSWCIKKVCFWSEKRVEVFLRKIDGISSNIYIISLSRIIIQTLMLIPESAGRSPTVDFNSSRFFKREFWSLLKEFGNPSSSLNKSKVICIELARRNVVFSMFACKFVDFYCKSMFQKLTNILYAKWYSSKLLHNLIGKKVESSILEKNKNCQEDYPIYDFSE